MTDQRATDRNMTSAGAQNQMNNVYILRPHVPTPRVSTWRSRDSLTTGKYYAEATYGHVTVGLWVERRGDRQWRFELVAGMDEVVAAGTATSLHVAKGVVIARADALFVELAYD